MKKGLKAFSALALAASAFVAGQAHAEFMTSYVLGVPTSLSAGSLAGAALSKGGSSDEKAAAPEAVAHWKVRGLGVPEGARPVSGDSEEGRNLGLASGAQAWVKKLGSREKMVLPYLWFEGNSDKPEPAVVERPGVRAVVEPIEIETRLGGGLSVSKGASSVSIENGWSTATEVCFSSGWFSGIGSHVSLSAASVDGMKSAEADRQQGLSFVKMGLCGGLALFVFSSLVRCKRSDESEAEHGKAPKPSGI